jgi:hypothetical protein
LCQVRFALGRASEAEVSPSDGQLGGAEVSYEEATRHRSLAVDLEAIPFHMLDLFCGE